MIKTYYEVHSDENENNIFESFDGKGAKQKAIAYAKRNREELTWVDKVYYNTKTEEYDYADCVWCYSWEE